MGHHDDREPRSASVGAFRPRITSQGLVVGMNVELHLGSRLDATRLSPGVTVGVLATEGTSLREIHERAAERALDLIRRMARVTPDGLRQPLSAPERFGDRGQWYWSKTRGLKHDPAQ